MSNAPEHAEVPEKWTLGSATYDNLRYFVNYILPAGAALYAGLAILFGFLYGDKVVGAAALVVIFLNVVLAKSKSNYNQNEKEKNPQVGTLYVNTSDPVEAAVGLDLEGVDPIALANKKTVTLKIDSQ